MGTVRKVGVIGMGHVGTHVANSLVLQGLVDELYLVDLDDAKREAEVQDLLDSASFGPRSVKVFDCGTEYERLAGCDLVVNAAGNVKMAAEDRDGELFFTTNTNRTWPQRLINDAGFSGVIVTIANPCDVIATEIHHLTGYNPRRIVGSGTALDSARLKMQLSRATGIDQHSINCYMLGEHGFSQFAAFSHVYFGCKPLSELAAEQPERFGFDHAEMEGKARLGGYVSMKGKVCTEYSIGNAATRIVQAILGDEKFVTCASTLMCGEYGEEGLYASLPCVIGKDGVEEVWTLNLTDSEVEAFHKSCEHIRGNIAQLEWWDETRHPEARA